MDSGEGGEVSLKKTMNSHEEKKHAIFSYTESGKWIKLFNILGGHQFITTTNLFFLCFKDAWHHCVVPMQEYQVKI